MLRRSHLTALLGAVTALGLLAAEYQAQERSRSWVNHSVAVLTEIQAVRSQLVEARNQYDIYMGGGTVADYRERLETLTESVDRLQGLTADNATQQKHLSEYRALVTFQPNKPKRQIFTDYQRRLFVQINQDEVDLLRSRQAQAEETLRLLDALTIAFFAMAAVATVHAMKEANQRDRAAKLLEVSQWALGKRTAQLEAIVSVIPAAVLIRDRSGVCLEVLSDGGGLRLADEMVGKTPFDVAPIAIAAQIMEAVTRALDEQRTTSIEFQTPLPDGRKVWLEMSSSPIDADTVLIVAQDNTKDHETQSRLLLLATTDARTGLYSSRYFESRVAQSIAQSARNFKRSFALLILDIDHLKHINSRYSQLGGDAAIVAIAQQLKRSVRPGDVPARLNQGGDEFALLLLDINKNDAIARAEVIRQSIKALQVEYDGSLIPVSVSIGVAMYPQGGETFHALYRVAALQLREGKHLGRDRVCAAG